MKKTMIALAIAAMPICASASESNGIGYTYAQLDYNYQDADSAYYNGGTVSGSYAINDNVFLTASYGNASDTLDGGSPSIRLTHRVENWSFGAGFNASIGPRADWVTQVNYADSDNKLSVRGVSCDRMVGLGCTISRNLRGGNVSTGVLGHVTDRLTANAYLGYEDYNHGYEGSYFADFGAVYAFNDTWGLHGGLKLADSTETYSVGVRASF